MGSIARESDKSSPADCFPKDGQPSMPPRMPAGTKQIWSKIVSQIPPQLLRKVDCWELGDLCRSILGVRRCDAILAKEPDNDRISRVQLQYMQHISRLSVRYGLTPCDRRKLTFVEDEVDEAAEWISS